MNLKANAVPDKGYFSDIAIVAAPSEPREVGTAEGNELELCPTEQDDLAAEYFRRVEDRL